MCGVLRGFILTHLEKARKAIFKTHASKPVRRSYMKGLLPTQEDHLNYWLVPCKWKAVVQAVGAPPANRTT